MLPLSTTYCVADVCEMCGRTASQHSKYCCCLIFVSLKPKYCLCRSRLCRPYSFEGFVCPYRIDGLGNDLNEVRICPFTTSRSHRIVDRIVIQV
jgi:hypothetical protein